MADDENFLARWSRRKRRRTVLEKAPSEASTLEAAQAAPGKTDSPLIDPATLPSLASIGAGSDLRAFLLPGVPADLARAALRRAWSVDPKIRDFIGLSENAWDFNAPGGVPGFGALTAEDVRALLDRLTGEAATAEPHSERASTAAEPSVEAPKDAQLSAPAPRGVINAGTAEPLVIEHENADSKQVPSLPRQRHGGALPK
jgi:hypothetical protein